jgi:hypothetical protein
LAKGLPRLAFLLMARLACGWVARQRDHNRPAARPLSEGEKERLGPYFEPRLLERARVRRPPRRRGLGLGAAGLVGRGLIAGMALRDTVVLGEGLSEALLFHELVHLVQYERLGLKRFLERYVAGWLRGGCRYRGIPLEAHAYELQRRFAAGEGFSVRAEVDKRLQSY